MLVIASFGQKKAVSQALKVAKDSRGSFAEARSIIKEALEHPETKDDANTWFTAGKIEELQFDKESTKPILGQQSDEKVMNSALINMYPYYKKAYELDQLPDAKGNVKPKFSKNISSILATCLNNYLNGGVYFYLESDYEKALQSFNTLIEIADGSMLPKKDNSDYKSDSSYILSTYYAAIAASQLNNHELTVEMMKRSLKVDYERLKMYEYLAGEYYNVNDTINWIKTLEEALSVYPTEEVFLLSLINLYIVTDHNDKAITYVNTALKLKPEESILYYIAGTIYESGELMDLDKSEDFYKKAIELDGEFADSQASMGRLYFNRAVGLLDEANTISDTKKFNEEKIKVHDMFKKALPYYEKAFKIEPTHGQAINALRNIYYHLEMGDKLDEMEKLFNE